MKVLDLLTYDYYKRKCISGSCSCIESGLQCTDNYVNQECDNLMLNEIESNDEDQYSDDDGIEDDNDI